MITLLLLASLGADPGLKAPPGFEVTQFADAKLANDIHCMTLDSQGQVFVSGRGFLRTLVDDDGDGKADRAVDFTPDHKDGAMGMLWEGSTLYLVGDGGLRLFTDRDGDLKADGPSKLIRAFKTGSEHAAHAVRRGPDGWLYVLCGNNTDIDRSYATLATSPIKDPTAGVVLRFKPDLTQSEIVCHGLRNPYGMDFSLDGELFAYDSDNERCVALPWYEPTRFYHILEGGNYGWLSPQKAQFWRLPPYYPDVIAPAATLGRGSPTGCTCYRHTQFPPEYRGSFFLADWTFGKVWHLPLERKGSSYVSTPRVFLEPTGNNGFAPTAIAVHPATGDLYVSIGGRGTRGGVYRIRYTAGLKDARPLPTAKRTLEYDAKALRGAVSPQPHERLNALLHLRRHSDKFEPADLMQSVLLNAASPHRYVRFAASRLASELSETDLEYLATKLRVDERAVHTLALAHHQKTGKLPAWLAGYLPRETADASVWRERMRLFQLPFGDRVPREFLGTVFEGYKRPEQKIKVGALRDPLDREQARLIAFAASDKHLGDIVAALSSANEPEEDFHLLCVIACLKGRRDSGMTQKIADALIQMEARLDRKKQARDSHWPLRLGELVAELAKLDPELPGALARHRDFGRPEHALFAKAPGFPAEAAARVFLKKLDDPSFTPTAAVVQVIGFAPPNESLPKLRSLWGQAGLDAAILPHLAKNPQPEDRTKFTQALASPAAKTVEVCLDALDKLPPGPVADEAFGLLRAWGMLSDKDLSLRDRLLERLRKVTAQKDLPPERAAWLGWFAKEHPDLAKRLTNPDGVDIPRWEKRLASIAWDMGDVGRGQKAFQKASCAACHSGAQALGPDLAGSGKRYSRADLFQAILTPSRDVPGRYQMISIETSDGKIFQGIVIYDAVDGIIVQSGPAETLRIAGDRIVSRRPSNISLMPAGLLDGLTDEEIADLYAYLKTR